MRETVIAASPASFVALHVYMPLSLYSAVKLKINEVKYEVSGYKEIAEA